MKFSKVVAQTFAWLQRERRVPFRALKREFDLEDDFLEDLKEELISVKEVAADKNGKMLVWKGAAAVPSTESRAPGPLQSLIPSTEHPSRGRGVFPQNDWDCATPASQLLGTARSDEPGAVVAPAR